MRSAPQPLVLGTTPAALPPQFATLDAALVVLDTAPHTAVLLATVAAVATALLLRCRPTAVDLAAVPATVALAYAAHKPTAFVLTACPPRAPEVAEAAAARAVAGGRAVTEFEPRGKAAQEITALWRWVQEHLLSGEGVRV